MNEESIDIKQTRLQKLKELFPELFAENQLDWEKLKAAFGDDINFANERFVRSYIEGVEKGAESWVKSWVKMKIEL